MPDGKHRKELKVPGSAALGKYAISLLWLASFTDKFTFADSPPLNEPERARPMHPIT
jgi:hypothetical protein